MKALTLAVFSILPMAVFAQGAWDMKYLPSDSLDNSFIGKEMRIDFKSDRAETPHLVGKNIRGIFSKRDTVTLHLAGKSLRFVEHWKLYVDHGMLSDQTLESVDEDDDAKLIVREMFLKAAHETFLTLRVYAYRFGDTQGPDVYDVDIDRSLVNGIIVRTDYP